MIKCPQTGRAILTGIKTDRESFRCSAVFFARAHCSICQTNHDWFAKEAWVYEPLGSFGHRSMMLPLPDDVLAHGASETKEVLRWPSCAAPRVHIVHRGVVVQMKQLKVNFCAVELPRVVVDPSEISRQQEKSFCQRRQICLGCRPGFPDQVTRDLLGRDSGNSGETECETDRAMSSLGKRRFRSTQEGCLLPLARK